MAAHAAEPSSVRTKCWFGALTRTVAMLFAGDENDPVKMLKSDGKGKFKKWETQVQFPEVPFAPDKRDVYALSTAYEIVSKLSGNPEYEACMYVVVTARGVSRDGGLRGCFSLEFCYGGADEVLLARAQEITGITESEYVRRDAPKIAEVKKAPAAQQNRIFIYSIMWEGTDSPRRSCGVTLLSRLSNHVTS